MSSFNALPNDLNELIAYERDALKFVRLELFGAEIIEWWRAVPTCSVGIWRRDTIPLQQVRWRTLLSAALPSVCLVSIAPVCLFRRIQNARYDR